MILALAAVTVTAGLIAAMISLDGAIAFLLATYLLGCAEVVLLIAALSAVGLLERGLLLIATAAALAALLIVGRGRPRRYPRLPSLRPIFHDPALAILALFVAAGFVYLAALALWTPANSWDAMWYHLARAAFWKQQHAVGYIAHANDLRLNANPPVAEIGALYTMVIAQTDRFVNLVSLSSYVVLIVAVVGVARRLGVEPRRAMLAGLVFGTFPIVVLQASGSLNDLPVAAFLCAAAYFMLGLGRRAELVLVALAVGLAVGSKLTAFLALPILAVIALCSSRRGGVLLAIAAGVAAGSGWYLVNLAETGAWDGGLAAATGSRAAQGVSSVAVTSRLLTDFAETPGAGGKWVLLYLAVAALTAAVAVRERRFVLGGLLALSPLVLVELDPKAQKGYQWLWFHLGRGDLGVIDQDRGFVGASALASFFGPLGVLLLLAGTGVAVAVLIRRASIPGLHAFLLAAPLLFAITLAVALIYDPYHGRFFIFPVALATAACARFMSRPIAWGVAAVAATTLVLTLRANDEKPLTLWGAPRWRFQTQVAGRSNGEKAVIRFVEESIPARARVGLELRSVDWSYPFFGRGLRRHISFVDSTESPDVGWLIVAPGKPAPAWRLHLRTGDGWRVFSDISSIQRLVIVGRSPSGPPLHCPQAH
jgi:hypothetical protein